MTHLADPFQHLLQGRLEIGAWWGGFLGYVYLLAWETPVDAGRLRAHHTLDLPLVFNNVETSPQKVADQMSSAWIAFAKSGNPNAEELLQRNLPYPYGYGSHWV